MKELHYWENLTKSEKKGLETVLALEIRRKIMDVYNVKLIKQSYETAKFLNEFLIHNKNFDEKLEAEINKIAKIYGIVVKNLVIKSYKEIIKEYNLIGGNENE